MLQKSQTKFGYARRILALPVVFTVAFAYMVNAKNKEIAKTNLEIEKAVSQIKKDTIRPDRSKNEQVRIYKKTNDEKKIAELGKKIEEKSKALKKLKPETQEFDKNVEEITQLSGEIAKITNSEDFHKSLTKIKVNGKEMNMDEFFNSDQWKNQMKDLKDFKFEMSDFPEFERSVFIVPTPPNAPRAPRVPRVPNPPSPPDAPQIRVFQSNGLKYPAYSKKAEREMKKARKLAEKAREAGEKARIQGEKARYENEKARWGDENVKLEADKIRKSISYNFNYTQPKVMKITANSMMKSLDGSNFSASGISKMDGDIGISKIYINGKDALEENVKVIIDGKEASRDDMKLLKGDQIESISIKKNSQDGKMTGGEISINTKSMKNKKDDL